MNFSWQRIKNGIKTLYPRKDTLNIITRTALYGLIGVLGFALVLVTLVWIGFFGQLPSKSDLKEIQHPLASEVYSSDSVLLGKYYIQDRSPVEGKDIPESLKKTLVATEDVRFYRHHGIDVKSLGRVLVKSILLQNESSGGGSTLTQQLAKNLFPRKSYGFLSLPINKVREYIIAWRIENVYSKDEIIVLYLNTIPFADNTYGIKTAAERFFSVPVKSLTWDQSAVLVGMLKATHRYNPRLFPERALQRRNVVLAQVAKYDYITDLEKKALQSKPLGLRYSHTASHNIGLAPYFRAYIQRELLQWCKENKKKDGTPYNLYKDGLKIYTTIDSRMQAYAESAVQVQMKALQAKFKGQISRKHIDGIAKSVLKNSKQFQLLKNEGLSEKQIMDKLNKPVKTKIFTWEGEKEATISTFDSIKHHLQFLQAGLIAMEPHTGDVKVWVGGINHQYFKYDHVRESTKRQVGSTFKPILYAAALEKGIGPCSYISARKTVYTNMDDWSPENTSDETYEMKYSMEGGLAGSVNTVSVKLLEKTGINNAIVTARKMGINSDLPAVPSIALGTPSISVMEMVGAYSVLANGGLYVNRKYLTAIIDRKGRVLEDFDNDLKPERAISKETSQMMVHMLKSVVSEGTASSLRSRYGLTNDIAGKTGTTQSNVDGWFIAIMPKLVVGAWVGADDPRMHFRSTSLGQGSATALPIVARFVQKANEDKKLKEIMQSRFAPLPEHLLSQLDCKPSKSNLNIFEKIFKKKKKVKITKFKGAKRKGDSGK
ncbi:penicillin-binding protein 1A [Chryseosolibacter indicus]|uniref:Transglycosylase domain-containing protein n=1 Tax=Chryseosolibacter indicus TaxID=2782351 RepID=A0ABS5VP41_9BACT|nr:transglycosylase domain-containing protein [Chryseosolibacter indicus]MBT1701776.1 transglycosylase domain-containing protein [Chryseosolibacter indicus]